MGRPREWRWAKPWLRGLLKHSRVRPRHPKCLLARLATSRLPSRRRRCAESCRQSSLVGLSWLMPCEAEWSAIRLVRHPSAFRRIPNWGMRRSEAGKARDLRSCLLGPTVCAAPPQAVRRNAALLPKSYRPPPRQVPSENGGVVRRGNAPGTDPRMLGRSRCRRSRLSIRPRRRRWCRGPPSPLHGVGVPRGPRRIPAARRRRSKASTAAPRRCRLVRRRFSRYPEVLLRQSCRKS